MERLVEAGPRRWSSFYKLEETSYPERNTQIYIKQTGQEHPQWKGSDRNIPPDRYLQRRVFISLFRSNL